MPNLNLTHNGNMNITSASLGSGGTLNVQYEPNLTGAITGWTITPESGRNDWESMENITIRFTPQFSGTVLTETFTVSGVDEAGIQRSDSSVLRQGFDTNLQHYIDGRFGWSGMFMRSSAFTENYIEFNVTLYGNVPGYEPNYCSVFLYGGSSGYDVIARWTGYIDTTPPGPDTGSSIVSLDLVVPTVIVDYGQASAVYTPSDAIVNLVYSLSNNEGEATIDPVTGEITVLRDGEVAVCVRDTISGLMDCKAVTVISSDEPGPDTGTTATAITINVADTITDTGFATTTVEPVGANVDLHYTSSSPNYATIDPITGEITVLQSTPPGLVVNFCVNDTVSYLSSCKSASVIKSNPDTGTVVSNVTIIVADNITNSGQASVSYSPVDVDVNLVYSSSDTSKATIDPSTGAITVLGNGSVTFCVTDTISGLQDCKVVSVYKEDTTIYATAVTLNVSNGIVDSGQATTTVNPSNAVTSLYYYSENPDIAEIDRYDGTIIVRRTGVVTFCVEERIKSITDCKTVTVSKTNPDTGATWNTGGTFTITFTQGSPGLRQIFNVSDYSGGFWPWYGYVDENGNPLSFEQALTGYTGSGRVITIYPDTGYLYIENGDIDYTTNTVTLTFEGVKIIPIDVLGEGPSDYNPQQRSCVSLNSFEIGYGIELVSEWAFHNQNCLRYNTVLIPETCGVDVNAFDSPVQVVKIQGGPYYPGTSTEKRFNCISFSKYTAYQDVDDYPTVYVPADQVAAFKSAYSECSDGTGDNWIDRLQGVTSSVRIELDSTITDAGVVNVVYDSGATVNLTYSSSDSTIATVSNSGIITVLREGVVDVCVYDSVSNLSDCKTITAQRTEEGETQYLTFEVLTNGSIVVSGGTYISFSNDSGATWTTSSSYAVNAGDIVFAKGNISTRNLRIRPTCQYNLSGNIQSLIYADNYKESYATDSGFLYALFSGSTNLISAENMVFPNVIMSYNFYNSPAYSSMFAGCTNLVKAPKKLGSKSLARECYLNMFSGCTSLTTAPELPATVVDIASYRYMFMDCANLTTAPELPATTLGEQCYEGMFWGCSRLTTAPLILPATTLQDSCYRSMFGDCSSLTSAPELPAETLVTRCYMMMFASCSSLNYVKCLATDIFDNMTTTDWVTGVSQTGTFVKNPLMSSWTTNTNGIPSGWTVVDAT